MSWWWLVWVGIGVLLVALLVLSWWWDRDARRRGARPLSGAEMGRDRRVRDRAIEQRPRWLGSERPDDLPGPGQQPLEVGDLRFPCRGGEQGQLAHRG